MSTTLAFDIIARDRASKSFDKVGDSAGRSSGRLKQFAKAGALAVAGAAVVAGKALFDMTKNAMADEAAQRKLAIGLKNSTGATKAQVAGVEDWIAKQGKVLGITDDELRPAFQRLAQATGDVGEAQRQMKIAMDVSAGTGKSLKVVSEALMKANNGTTASLSKLGLKTKDAEGKTLSLDDALKSMSKTFSGQAAAAANTTEGKMQRLTVMFDEAKESIGSKLIPVADKMATVFLRDVVPAAQKVGQWLQEKLGPPLRELAERFLPMAKERMSAMKAAFEDARPFIDLVGKILGKVVVPALGKLMDVAGPALNLAIRGLGKALGFVGETGKWMWNTILQPVFKLLISAIATAADGFAKMLGALGKAPGFGWAKDAARAMEVAAGKARNLADNINKIPDQHITKIVYSYEYRNLKDPTRGRDLGGPVGRGGALKRSAEQVANDVMDTLAEAYRRGGKKVQKVLKDNVERMRDTLKGIRDEMRSLSSSIAQALTPDAFGFTDIAAEVDSVTGQVTTAAQSAMSQSLGQLNATNQALSALLNAFPSLSGSVSRDFLSSIMQSGNTSLMLQYAADPAAAAEASRLFDANNAMASSLGDKTSDVVLGDRFEKALDKEFKRLRKDLEDLPEKQAKKLGKEMKDWKFEIHGNSGQRVYLRTG